MTAEIEWTVEKLQQELLNVEKRGNFNYVDIIPLWEKAKEKIENEEQAVSLYTTFIYLTRRHLQSQDSQDYSKVDELFQEAIEFIGECFGEEEFTEASAKLQKNYAYFLYTKMRKPEPARQIWNNLLVCESGPFAWIEAILLERAYGDIEHARLLFYNALEAVTFRPHDIFAAFVQFEREEGTRKDLDKALECINAKAAKFNARAEQHQYFRQKQDRIHAKETQPQQRKGRKQQQQNGRGKRDGEESKAIKDRQQNQSSNKNAKQKQPAGKQQNQRKTNTIKSEEQMVEEAPASTFQTSVAPIGPIIPGMAMETKEEEIIDDQQKIWPKMEKVQSQKMEMDDGMEEAEEKMIENTGEDDSIGIGGRKRRRKISDDGSASGKATPFPYGTSLEKNKLFIKQLHFGCKAKELKEFFGRFGKVLDARIVTKWNGKSKGCAYVDFATDEEAGAAVMGADGAEIRGRKIAVFLSNPRQKRPRMEFGASLEGGGEGEEQKKLPRATEKQQQIAAPKKTLGQGNYGLFTPRSVAATSSTAAQRAGKGGRLALLPRSIRKTAAITDSAQSINSTLSPMGAVTHSTEEMNLSCKIGNEDGKKDEKNLANIDTEREN